MKTLIIASVIAAAATAGAADTLSCKRTMTTHGNAAVAAGNNANKVIDSWMPKYFSVNLETGAQTGFYSDRKTPIAKVSNNRITIHKLQHPKPGVPNSVQYKMEFSEYGESSMYMSAPGFKVLGPIKYKCSIR